MGRDLASIAGSEESYDGDGGGGSGEGEYGRLKRYYQRIKESFNFYEYLLWAADGNLELAEKIYEGQNYIDVMKAIRYNVRKELISVYSPILPQMKKKERQKILKEIEDLSPKRKTVKNTNIADIEKKRYERLKKEGHFGTSRNSKT